MWKITQLAISRKVIYENENENSYSRQYIFTRFLQISPKNWKYPSLKKGYESSTSDKLALNLAGNGPTVRD